MIRAYRHDDLPDLLDAWYEASLIAHPFLDEAFFDAERVLIAEVFLPASDVTVAVADERVVGFISMADNEVGGFFVHPAHQGQGHGRELMDAARATRPVLELDVFEANPIGRRFYESYGFREVGRGVDDATGHPQVRLRLD